MPYASYSETLEPQTLYVKNTYGLYTDVDSSLILAPKEFIKGETVKRSNKPIIVMKSNGELSYRRSSKSEEPISEKQYITAYKNWAFTHGEDPDGYKKSLEDAKKRKQKAQEQKQAEQAKEAGTQEGLKDPKGRIFEDMTIEEAMEWILSE